MCPVKREAQVNILSTNSSKLRPNSAAAMGTKDFSVIPGTVFNSRIDGSHFSSQIKSTLAQCLQPSVSKALIELFFIFSVISKGRSAGQMYFVSSLSYLLKVFDNYSIVLLFLLISNLE